jgi:hypothetical protein
MTTEKQIQSWKDRLPEDLTFGEFDEEFQSSIWGGAHYQYGAWDTNGVWVLAWNTEAQFRQQVAALDEPSTF